MDEPGELTVCYNGACPVCRAEVEHYRRRAADGSGLAFLDAAANPAAAARLGLGGDRAFRRLHVVDARGQVVGGIGAFLAVWRRLPGYGWLARLVRHPMVRPATEFAYERLAAPLLFRLHLRRERRAAAGSRGG